MGIKLRKPAHDRFSRVVGWLCLLGWIGGVLFTFYAAVSKYAEARSVLDNHVVIPAALELDRVSESYKRRAGVRNTYHFRYTFEVDGETHEGRMAVSENNVEQYLRNPTVEIAFSTSNRTFQRLSMVEGKDSIPGLVGGTLMMIFVFGIGALLFFAYLTAQLFQLHPDDRHLEDDEEAEAEAAARA